MKALRIGICALVAFAVFAHGAVEPWSEAVLEIGAAVLLVYWAALFLFGREEVRWNPLLIPTIALGAFGFLQWAARITVYPYLTQVELLKYCAYLVVFFLTVQAFRKVEDWKGLAGFLLTLGFVVSLFGILQHFTFNGKLYWLRELRYGGTPFGPYVNRNHFAGFVELIVPTGVAMLVLRAIRRDLLPLTVLFTLLPVGALFLAASRGGIASLVVEVGLLGVLVWAWRREPKSLVAGALVVVLGVALVAWLGIGRAMERFSQFEKLEVSEGRRIAMSKDTWHILLDHPLTGTGLGTLVSVYPRYETFYDGKLVNHAHNDYVELLADTGVIGGMICLGFLILLARSALANLKASGSSADSAIHLGALVACAGLLFHSFMDFNLHVPSNTLLFLLQAAAASSPVPSVRNQEALGRVIRLRTFVAEGKE